MKDFNRIGEDLFDKLRGRFREMTIGDEDGNVTNEPSDARFFDFEYTESGAKLGKVSVSVSEDDGLTVIYSRDFVQNEDEMTQKNWYNFLRELRRFSKKRLLNFDVRDINKSNLTKRDYKFLATNRPEDITMTESKLYGTGRVSYQNVDNARMVIKHTENIDQENTISRTRKIGSIYIESAEGERFKYPYRHLSGARAMARHVAEGGNPYDDFGSHIIGLSEEMSKLRKCKNYMGRSAVMAEGLADYMDIVKERIGTVKKTIENLQKPNYYQEAFDGFEKPIFEDVPEDVAENWIDELTIRQFNEELKDVFPYIYNLVKEGTKSKALGPEDFLGEETDDVNLDEADRYRSNKNYQLADQNYNNFKIYVSIDRIVQNQYMATALSNTSDKEPEGIRTLANKPEAAVEEVKQKLDNRTTKAKKVTGNATLDFNAAFTRDFFENDADDLGVETFKMMYVKIVPGPKLIIANTAEFGDMPQLLTSDGFSRAGNRQQQGNPMASVTLSSKRLQNAELVANGRYIIGDPKQDKDGHYVYPMMFESIVLDKGEKVRFKKPAVTIGTQRDESVSETSDQGKFQVVRKSDGKVLDNFTNEKLANQHYHVKKGWAEVKSVENEDLMSEDDDPCWKNYKQVGMKKKNGKKVPNCVPKEEIELEQGFEEMMGQFAEDTVEHGRLYVKFRAKKTPGSGPEGAKEYLTAFADFAQNPNQVKEKTALRKFTSLTNMKEIANSIKKLMKDKTFVSAKQIILYRDSGGLEKKFPQLREFYDWMGSYKGDQIKIEEPPEEDKPEIEKGAGKKRLPKGHFAANPKDYDIPDKKMTRYFTIDNSRLLNFLRREMPDFIQQYFRPNFNGFVMDDKAFRQFRKFINSPKAIENYGPTQVKVDKEKSFAEDNSDDQSQTPLSEFILSYFDYTSGQFPKGETAVLTMVEKDYGEEFIEPAKAFMERINERVAEVMGFRQEPEIQELDDVTRLAGL